MADQSHQERDGEPRVVPMANTGQRRAVLPRADYEEGYGWRFSGYRFALVLNPLFIRPPPAAPAPPIIANIGIRRAPRLACAFDGEPLTQQIFIRNDVVGAIIGKGCAKINEIRQLSGSVVGLNEPQDNSNGRLVTFTGTIEDYLRMILFALENSAIVSRADVM